MPSVVDVDKLDALLSTYNDKCVLSRNTGGRPAQRLPHHGGYCRVGQKLPKQRYDLQPPQINTHDPYCPNVGFQVGAQYQSHGGRKVREPLHTQYIHMPFKSLAYSQRHKTSQKSDPPTIAMMTLTSAILVDLNADAHTHFFHNTIQYL